MSSAGMAAVVRADNGDCCCEAADSEWGRLSGAAPPLASWWPVLVWATGALVLILTVFLVVRVPGPLDDPRAADQRDGLLLDGPVVPARLGGLQLGGRTVVVLFERRPPTGPRFRAWRDAASGHGVIVDVVVAGTPGAAELRRVLNLPVPVDGGPPVGYAVIDPTRQIRYATLDPAYLDNAFEVDVITAAVAGHRP